MKSLKLCNRSHVSDVVCCATSLLQVDSIAEQFEKEMDENFRKPKTSRLQPGTFKGYISHRIKFLTHLTLLDKVTQDSLLVNKIQSLIRNFAAMSNSLKPEVAERKRERRQQELNNPITAKEVVQFEASSYIQDSIKTLNRLGVYSDKKVQQIRKRRNSVTSLRNALIALAQVKSGQRAGPFRSMTLKEMETANKTTHEGEVWYTINVFDHKTQQTHGDAPINIEERYYTALCNYAKYLRPEFRSKDGGAPKPESEPVFLTSRGQQLETCFISDIIKSAWKRSHVRLVKSCTQIRKCYVRHVFKKAPEMKGDLAKMMTHREDTQRNHYYAPDEDSTVHAARAFRNSLRKCAEEGQISSQVTQVELFKENI